MRKLSRLHCLQSYFPLILMISALLSWEFTHFFRRFFWTDKQNTQTFSLLGFMGGPYTKCPKPHIPIYQSATCDHLDKCLQMDRASLYISVRGWGEDCYIVLFMRCLFTCRRHCNDLWVKTRGDLVKVANCKDLLPLLLEVLIPKTICKKNSPRPPPPLHCL